MTQLPPQGWYPDPERPDTMRWWDGTQWAAPQDQGGAPAAADPSATQEPADAAGQAGSQQPAFGHPNPTAESGQGGYGSGPQDPYGQYSQAGEYTQPAQWQSEPAKSNSSLAIVIGVSALVVVLLGVIVALVIGLVMSGDDDESENTDSAAVEEEEPQTSPEDDQPAQDSPEDEPAQDQADPGDTAGGEVVDSFQMQVPEDDQATETVTIEEAGTYVIDVESTNDEDPTITLTAPDGFEWEDDDGGDGFDSRLTQDLETGDYQLMVEEYLGNQLSVEVTVTRQG